MADYLRRVDNKFLCLSYQILSMIKLLIFVYSSLERSCIILLVSCNKCSLWYRWLQKKKSTKCSALDNLLSKQIKDFVEVMILYNLFTQIKTPVFIKLLYSHTSSVDYWSLGLVSYEAITGVRPFLPNASSPAEWLVITDNCTYALLSWWAIGR